MKHAQAQEKTPERAEPRKREANATESPAPRARVKGERKPLAKADEAPDAAGANPPPTGKQLPRAADSDSADSAQDQAADRPPADPVPVAIAALVLPPVPASGLAAVADADAASPPTPAPAPIVASTAAAVPTPAPASATTSPTLALADGDALPDGLPDAGRAVATPAKVQALPTAPTPPAAAQSVAPVQDSLPPAPAVDATAVAQATQNAAVTTPTDSAAAVKPKFNLATSQNPAATGRAEQTPSPAAQTLISNPVPALNAAAPGAERDAASRGTALLQAVTAAAPEAASPVAPGAVHAAATSAAGATAAVADPAVFKLHHGLDSPDFPQVLADKVAWLVDKDIGSAKLQISPPQLGPIDVHIEVQGDKAQVWLSAHSVVTREALDASSPKLRELLGSQGFAQVSVDVSQRSFQDRSAPAPQTQWLPASARTHPEELFSAPASPPRNLGPGALDAYA